MYLNIYLCMYTSKFIGVAIITYTSLSVNPPTFSASSVLDILCHHASTHQQSKAARQQGSKSIAARQQGSKAAREQGSKAGKTGKAGKAASQQASKTARQLIHGSKFKLSRARPFGINGWFSLGWGGIPKWGQNGGKNLMTPWTPPGLEKGSQKH